MDGEDQNVNVPSDSNRGASAGEAVIDAVNHPKAGSIEAIDYKSVHRICSGQVVLTLATAVKELVENSIDAGATKVEIKLKEYGSEIIEVNDNGSGVVEENFEGLTLKHHTSKLKDFSDLSVVETFGFRGEALSSLCALSDLTITTRHETATVATKLEFDHNGKITSKSHCARQQGTTIILQNLFYTLPVRHKEFQRNLKKEFCKMVNVLNAYCIVNVNVRLSCYNQSGKGSKNLVASSLGNSSMKENIRSIFGLKQLQTINEFVQIKPTQELCEEFGIKVTEKEANLFKLEGFVSKCEHNSGRSTTDRQFFFINKRPCDSTKMSKVVNDVYHMYNRHQYPFVVLHVNIAKESVDVNVTPDKRQIFLENEKLLLATIKASLITMYEPTSSVYKVNQLTPITKSESSSFESLQLSSPVQSQQDSENFEQNNQSLSRSISTLAQLKRSFSSAFVKEDSVDMNPSSKSFQFSDEKQRRISASPKQKSKLPADGILKWMTAKYKTNDNEVVNCKTDSSNEKHLLHHLSTNNQEIFSHEECEVLSSPKEKNQETFILTPHTLSLGCSPEISKDNKEKTESLSSPSLSFHSDKQTQDKSKVHENKEIKIDQQKIVTTGQEESHQKTDENATVTHLEFDTKNSCLRKERKLLFSMKSLQQKLEQIKTNKGKSDEEFCRSFRAKISPGENQAAEEELKKYIDKTMFEQMEILGQFNLGFIIARLNDDLFIIDQHATDEKYNFETLRRHTVMQGQKLICPLNLELTASNEIILMDNVEIFQKNGFDFIIDELSAPGQRVKLLTAPVSKNWNFGKDDIEELIFMLQDSPGVMCRPSRIRQMLASRACRKSVMIGTALNKREMKKLVKHMSELDQPWNCPHGRPTMRHLINLNMLST